MSKQENTDLELEALEWADRWEGTLHAEILRSAIKSDPEALYEAIQRAKTDWYDLEERTVEYDEVI
jgi:hypothetical protein